MDVANSKNGVPIRMTAERWQHITTGHPEVSDYYYEILETIENPQTIYEGNNKAKIAVKTFKERNDKFVVVIYKELGSNEGFVITAYLSTRKQEFKKKRILWEQPN
jgi:hypothetical protein